MARISTFATAAFLSVCTAYAQKTAFDAATIKPNLSGQDGGTFGPRGDSFVGTNITLSSLLSYAYAPAGGNLLRAQIVDGPDWANTDHFDIQARLGGNTQIKLMLQSLLEDRFQLKAHRENRSLPVYNLVIVKRGPTLSADQTPPAPSFIQFSSSGEQLAPLPRGAMRIVTGTSANTLSGSAVPVSKLLSLLQGQSDRIIVDKTEFNGLFDFNLEYATPQQAESSAPSLFTAIQDIGMKLESAKAPVEVLVVESVHKPTEN